MASNEPNVSERLAYAFANWQHNYFAYEFAVAMMRNKGEATDQESLVSKNGHRLAQAILDNRVQALVPEEWRPSERLARQNSVGGRLYTHYGTFPLELFKWNRCSRRVYHLPHQLEALLASATLPEIRWCDVMWPFESFIITLERPVQTLHPGGFYELIDTLLVTKADLGEGDGPGVCIRWFQVPQKSGMRLGLSISEVAQFEQLLKRKEYNKAARLLDGAGNKMVECSPALYGSQRGVIDIDTEIDQRIEIEPEELYRKNGWGPEPWEKCPDSTRSLFETISVTMRIVIGWMLYLETLSKTSVLQRRESRKGHVRAISGGASGIITEPEHIFDIIGRGQIGKAQKGTTSETRHRNGPAFIRPHWRSPYWRRPWGSPLDAEKTLRIPAKLVREDLVPLYGIIGGTKTVVILEE